MAGFCKYCGRSLQDGEECHCRDISMPVNEIAEVKKPKAIGIVNIVAGALMLFIGMADIDYDWGMIAMVAGIGFLVTGILELVKKNLKAAGVIQVIFGIASVLVGAMCNLEFDWGYVGIIIGIAFFIVGILRLMKKSVKATAIIEIVFAGILLIFACIDMDYDWGVTALLAGIGLLVSGIVFLVSNRQKN